MLITKDTFSTAINKLASNYVRKWLGLSILIGIAAGLGAIVFYWAISEVTGLMMETAAGYNPPGPAGEGPTIFTAIARPWLFPIITGVGGLISGLIVFKFAPEAEGHGTDSAIDAFHNRGGFIRRRVPLVKVVASAITIGTGGSAGREGPTAQIAAGVGSALADLFKLEPRDRRIAMAVGIGAGIGAIFKAPLGGAILSMEILYRRDFETEALMPSFIASVIGYSIFGYWNGWTPVFGDVAVQPFHRIQELFAYILLGLACGVFGALYGRSFYRIRDFFRDLKIPDWSKPAIGGLLVGLMGVFLPQVLGMGYGWIQFAMEGDFVSLPIGIMIALIFGKIIATGLSIGSGGSGGVFAPGLVIGGMVGGVLWSILHSVTGITPASPASFVIVGMLALFGGIAKAPLAVILMVSEMTSGYELLMPSMLACTIAYVVTGKSYIYEYQVMNRAQSPAHIHEHSIPLLKMLKVKEAMIDKIVSVPPDVPVSKVVGILKEKKIDSVVVKENNEMKGIITTVDVMATSPSERDSILCGEIMSRDLIVTYPEESLYNVMRLIEHNEIHHIPVVERKNPKHIVGIITMIDIMRLYSLEVENGYEPKNFKDGRPQPGKP